jgi:hypothetical protein
VVIETECAHCGQSMVIEMDSELQYRIVEGGTEPLVFVPSVNLARLTDPSIIDAF